MNAKTETTVPATRVVTGRARGSYVHVFKARLNDLNGVEEYSLAVLVPKEDTRTVDAINRAVEAATAAKWNGKPPPNLRHPLRDGDTERSDEAYAGHWFFNAKSRDRPGIVDRHVQPVIDPQEFCSGDYCRVSCNAYAYDQKGNRGVAFGLQNIQVLERGDPLTGRSRPEDDFGDGFGGTAAAADADDRW